MNIQDFENQIENWGMEINQYANFRLYTFAENPSFLSQNDCNLINVHIEAELKGQEAIKLSEYIVRQEIAYGMTSRVFKTGKFAIKEVNNHGLKSVACLRK